MGRRYRTVPGRAVQQKLYIITLQLSDILTVAMRHVPQDVDMDQYATMQPVEVVLEAVVGKRFDLGVEGVDVPPSPAPSSTSWPSGWYFPA